MTLKERISDIFEKYSVELAVEEKEETQEVALMLLLSLRADRKSKLTRTLSLSVFLLLS